MCGIYLTNIQFSKKEILDEADNLKFGSHGGK